MSATPRMLGLPGMTCFARQRLSVPLLVVLGAIILQVIGFDPVLNVYDEGIILVGAERVRQGEVPYRDFWTIYAPAQFYLVSFLYGVIGTSDLALRLVGILAKALIVGLSYGITARLAPRALALAAAGVILLLLLGQRQDGFPVFPALALALAALLLLDTGLRRGPWWHLGAGLCIGLAALFRQDLGAYAAIALGLLAVLLAALRAREVSQAANLIMLLSQLGALTAGMALVLGPAIALLLQAVPARDLYESLIAIPASVYPAVRSLPFPPLATLSPMTKAGLVAWSDDAVYLPFLMAAWVTAGEAFRFRTGRPADSTTASLVAAGWALIPGLVIACLIFTLKGLVRVSALHMVQSLVLAVILLAVGLARTDWHRWREGLVLAPGAILGLLLLAAPVALGAHAAEAGFRRAFATGPDSLAGRCLAPVLPRLHCIEVDPYLLAAARYVMAHAPEEARIYVGTGRHDRIFINAVAFYFMAERRSATHWHELHPGIQTTAAVQDAMLREFEAAPPRLVILDTRWDQVTEPNASSQSSGVTRLDAYLRAQFAEVAQFGPVRVLAPRR